MSGGAEARLSAARGAFKRAALNRRTTPVFVTETAFVRYSDPGCREEERPGSRTYCCRVPTEPRSPDAGGKAMDAIDFRVRLRTEHMLKPWNPDCPAPHFEQYIRLYRMEPRLTALPTASLIRDMADAGIGKGVLCGGSYADNNHLKDVMASECGDSFFYVAGIEPSRGIRSNVTELSQCRDSGFVGANISPYIWGIPANDATLYPIYAFCEHNNMVAIVHGSLHYNRYQSMWLGQPQYMDEIAMHFPALKLVVSHAGNGFGVLALAVAQKHPNIFLEFSALWPDYLPEATLQAVNTYLRERCLFGTDYPLVEFAPAVAAWSSAVRPTVRDLFFRENALRCLLGEAV